MAGAATADRGDPVSEIEKASREAVEASRQGDQFALMLAAVQAAQQTKPAPCQHQRQASARPFDARKAVAYTVCGCAAAACLSMFFMAFAFGAVGLTVCVVVLRSVWADFTNRKG